MQNRLFKSIINAAQNGKYDKNFFWRCKFSDEILTQEQALEIFALLGEFEHKYNNYFKNPRDIKLLKKIFFNIAHSYPIEGVFENLSFKHVMTLNSGRIERYFAIGIDYLKKDFQNETNVALLSSAFKPITEKIREFCQNYAKQINLTEFFIKYIADFFLSFGFFVSAIQETLDLVAGKAPPISPMLIINENTSLNLSLNQKRILENAKSEILNMKDILRQIAGLDSSGGYSSLSTEQKYLYRQLPNQFKNWEKAFDIINNCRFEFELFYKNFDFLRLVHCVKDRLLNCVNVNGIINNELSNNDISYQYTEGELAIFKFPRPINTSQYKLSNEKNLLAETSNVIQNFDTPLRHA